MRSTFAVLRSHTYPRAMALRAALLAAASFALSLALAPTASAQPTSEGGDAEARALFEAGQVAFREGRFEDALTDFQHAYDRSPRPLLLFNIGTAADRLRRDAVALDAFERYLAAMPEATNAVEVRARIDVLRDAVARASADEPPDTAPEPTAEEPPSAAASDPTPWIVTGVGGAVLVAGAVLLGLGMADAAAVTNAAQGSDWSSVAGAYDRAEPLSIAGIAALGAGGAAVIAGIVWGATSGGSSSPRARLLPLPGGLSLHGVF